MPAAAKDLTSMIVEKEILINYNTKNPTFGDVVKTMDSQVDGGYYRGIDLSSFRGMDDYYFGFVAITIYNESPLITPFTDIMAHLLH